MLLFWKIVIEKNMVREISYFFLVTLFPVTASIIYLGSHLHIYNPKIVVVQVTVFRVPLNQSHTQLFS